LSKVLKRFHKIDPRSSSFARPCSGPCQPTWPTAWATGSRPSSSGRTWSESCCSRRGKSTRWPETGQRLCKCLQTHTYVYHIHTIYIFITIKYTILIIIKHKSCALNRLYVHQSSPFLPLKPQTLAVFELGCSSKATINAPRRL
jgi:hypothetical protein